MKSLAFISLIFFTIGCSRVELVPVTSENLLEKISNLKGHKAVLVNIWALWCKPCVDEFPMIAKLKKENIDLEVIFVNADFIEDLKKVVSFLEGHNIGPISYIKSEKDDLFISGLHPNWTGSLPFTLVYGKKNGHLVDYWEGKKPFSKFKQVVKTAIDS